MTSQFTPLIRDSCLSLDKHCSLCFHQSCVRAVLLIDSPVMCTELLIDSLLSLKHRYFHIRRNLPISSLITRVDYHCSSRERMSGAATILRIGSIGLWLASSAGKADLLTELLFIAASNSHHHLIKLENAQVVSMKGCYRL